MNGLYIHGLSASWNSKILFVFAFLWAQLPLVIHAVNPQLSWRDLTFAVSCLLRICSELMDI